MGLRAGEDAVRKIADADPERSVTLHMETANTVTDAIATEAAAQDITITAARLKLIETYLAAHFYRLEDLGVMEEQTGRARTRYEGKTGKFFELTRQGQMAMALDPTDFLRSGPRIQVEWIGTERT